MASLVNCPFPIQQSDNPIYDGLWHAIDQFLLTVPEAQRCAIRQNITINYSSSYETELTLQPMIAAYLHEVFRKYISSEQYRYLIGNEKEIGDDFKAAALNSLMLRMLGYLAYLAQPSGSVRPMDKPVTIELHTLINLRNSILGIDSHNDGLSGCHLRLNEWIADNADRDKLIYAMNNLWIAHPGINRYTIMRNRYVAPTLSNLAAAINGYLSEHLTLSCIAIDTNQKDNFLVVHLQYWAPEYGGRESTSTLEGKPSSLNIFALGSGENRRTFTTYDYLANYKRSYDKQIDNLHLVANV